MNERFCGEALQVRMLGGLSICYQGREVLSDRGRNAKTWDMLEYLLANRKRGYSTEDLVELLCHNDMSGNPTAVIKNLAYRLRKLLTQAGLPGDEIIVYQRGVYCWNPRVPVEIDVERFEECWKKAENRGLPQKDRLCLYQEAIDLYRGRLLTKSASKDWVIPLSAYYHRLYISSIHRVFDILSQGKNLEQMVNICNNALVIDPYDESLYEMLMRSLICLGNLSDALTVYDRMTSLFFDELGTTPSQRVRNLYREMIKPRQLAEQDILEIQRDLTEPGKLVHGAYLCDFALFKTVYRFTARTMERTVQSVFLVVFTLSGKKGAPRAKGVRSSMGLLEKVIGSSLRKGDAYARYSPTQYIVMLCGVNDASCRLVAGRILENFSRFPASRHSILSYSLNPVTVGLNASKSSMDTDPEA